MPSGNADRSAILLIRLSAMGDILHTLPAATTLKKSFPNRKLVWLVASRWKPLLDGNPFVDEIIPFDRARFGALAQVWSRLRQLHPEWAFDFQGLVQSALMGRAAQPRILFGFDQSVAREPLASMFYTRHIPVKGPHRVERNVQLAQAAAAREISYESWIPPGMPQGDLPSGQFVLTNPFAGWAGKQWPLASYEALGERLQRNGLELLASVPEHRARDLAGLKHVRVHTSTLPGLIAATRRATAVIGLDSGPLHLAAALAKPGVALYGPTDPLCTGPFGGTITVLRADDAETTYKRHGRIHSTMKLITVEQVAEALSQSLTAASTSLGAANRLAVVSRS